jgi:HAD superfamily hydrolase (TIGR01490 family)
VKKLAVFDLDETITTKDTFLEFLKYTHGTFGFYARFTLVLPFALLMVLRLYSNTRLKELALTLFYNGYNANRLLEQGNAFASTRIPTMLNKEVYTALLFHKSQGHRVVVLTASCNIWVNQWCINEGIELISSELEIVDGKITGKLKGKNCHGQEKPVRLKKLIDITSYEMYAYGNAPSDKYYIELAQHKHYV